MEDTRLFFEKLLGIGMPWHITEVTQDHGNKRVDLRIEHSPSVQFPCPTCQAFCPVYDHAPEREFRHLNLWQMATYLHVQIPRINCPTHGIQQIIHGLSDPKGTVTYEFERFVIDLEHECTPSSIGRMFGLDWHLCQTIQERAVRRGLDRKEPGIPTRIGVDEKAFSRGQTYESIVYNLDKGTVEAVMDDRGQESLEAYYKRFSPEERAKVEAVAMDMWDPYIAATKAYIPDANKKIVFDRYHVMRIVTKAVDTVRKEENRALVEKDIDLLKGTKYLWLWNDENVPAYRREEFDKLRAKDLKISRAWWYKETIRRMWTYASPGWMRRFFNDWHRWVAHSRLTPMIEAAKTLKVHLENIVTYAKHRITNALGESLNSKIEKVKRMACGYRNRTHYRLAIFFHCGGLSMYPRRSSVQMQIIPA